MTRSRWLTVLALAITAAHWALAPGYGYFRDEFYYVACGRHLAFGYVDHPPLIAAVAAAVSSTLGSSLYALRFVPAVCAGAVAWLSGACAAELDARPFGQLGAALTLSLAPLIAALCSFFSMNALDLVFWGLSFWLVLRLLREATLARWLSLGLVLGVGLENKLSVLWLGAGLALGLIAARRDLLRTRGPYLCAAVALVCFAPHVIWQVRLGFPTLEFIHNARSLKMQPQTVGSFASALILQLNPLALPLWLVGLAALIRARFTRPLGICIASVFVLLVVGDGKPYYAAPLFLPLAAAGWSVLDRFARLRVAALCLLTLSGLALLPIAKPVLPVAQFLHYQAALGLAPQGVGERQRLGQLPQFFADMFGWRELAADVEAVQRELPSPACVLTENYGQAGALEHFLERPSVISGHNSYWLWGAGSCTGNPLIAIGRSRERLERMFEDVRLAGTHHCELCMPFENDKPLWIVDKPREPLDVLWPELKHYE